MILRIHLLITLHCCLILALVSALVFCRLGQIPFTQLIPWIEFKNNRMIFYDTHMYHVHVNGTCILNQEAIENGTQIFRKKVSI